LTRIFAFSIPDTFVLSTSHACVGICVSSTGSVSIIEDVSPDNVIDSLSIGGGPHVYGVTKRIAHGTENRTSTMAIPTIHGIGTIRRMFENNWEENTLCIQRFIAPRQNPYVIRVWYSKESGSCRGIVISNKSPIPIGDPQSDTELTRKWCVSLDTSNGVSLVAMSGRSALEVPGQIARRVMYFIENVFALRLSDIVIDLVGETLLQVKSFTVVSVPKVRASIQRSSTALKRLTCGICREGQRGELSKCVTTRMVSDCLKHLLERSIEGGIVERLKCVVNCHSSTCATMSLKCCDECYTMILNEQQLVECEKKFLNRLGSLMCKGNEDKKGLSRILILIGDFGHIPEELVRSLLRVKIRLGNHDHEFVMKARPYIVLEYPKFDPGHVMGDALIYVVVVRDGSSDPVGKGSIDCLNRLSIGSKISGTNTVQSINCYLGRGKFFVSVTIGLENCRRSTDPLPDSWVHILSSGGRRRSRSVSRTRTARSLTARSG
jgi:hypothetical protein